MAMVRTTRTMVMQPAPLMIVIVMVMVMVMVRQPAPLLLLSLLPFLAPSPPRRLNVTKINIFRNQKCICLFVKLQHCDTTRSLGEDLLIVCKAAVTAAVLVIICLHVSK